MSKITKAIIPVAGWGTRRLPITKAIEKCMLPIGNRPIVDYVVQDCIGAGITDIYFVVSTSPSQLEAFYGQNLELEEYLEKNGKTDLIPQIAPLENVNFHYVVQNTNSRYGTAVPVSLVFDQVEEGESVLVLMGDDFTYSGNGRNDVAKLIESTPAKTCGLLGAVIDPSEVERYGVVEFDDQHNFIQIVEKPARDQAPSNIINISKYVLSYRAVELVYKYVEAAEHSGEYMITIPLNDFVVEGGTMKVIPADGDYLDGGTIEGWLHANQVVADASRQK